MKPRIRVPALSRPAPKAALDSASAYDAGDSTATAIAAWRPWRQHPDSEIGVARSLTTARSRDLVRNNGWTTGALRRETDSVVGARFRPRSRPDFRSLGIDREEAQRIGAEMDAAWRDWADDPRMLCDCSRSLDWGGLAALAYSTYLAEGDALAVLHWEAGPWEWRTRLRVVDPDLLSNPYEAADTSTLRGGVELDAHGAAMAYHFRREHPSAAWSINSTTWDRVQRETPWGRPIVVHFFDKGRDGQTRGVSRLAPVMDALKMEDKGARVTLQQMILSALLGLYVSLPLDANAVADLLDDGGKGFLALDKARQTLADAKALTFGGVRIPVLAPGDSIETVTAAAPTAQYEAFQTTVLRRIATGLGTSYEQLANDWSKVNYSSARAAMLEVWRGWTARRIGFAQRFCAPIRMAVIEEAVDSGRVRIPGGIDALHENTAAWLRAKWIGPGRGFVDPVKEAQAAAMRVSLGLSTLEDEAAELSGEDYADNLAQIGREIEAMPEGVLHPAQVEWEKLVGARDAQPVDQEEARP